MLPPPSTSPTTILSAALNPLLSSSSVASTGTQSTLGCSRLTTAPDYYLDASYLLPTTVMPCCGPRHPSRDSGIVGKGSGNGLASTLPPKYERVMLAIKGLKCGCCEDSISKAIGRISAIRNHQVNIVLARVEFELDTNRSSVAEAIKEFHGATGYAFEEYTPPQGTVLEFLVNDPAAFCRLDMPPGVTLVDSGEKKAWIPSRLFSRCNSLLHLDSQIEQDTRVEAAHVQGDALDESINCISRSTQPPSPSSYTGWHAFSSGDDYPVKEHAREKPISLIGVYTPCKEESLVTASPAKKCSQAMETSRPKQGSPGRNFFQQTVVVHYHPRAIGAREIQHHYKELCPDQDIRLAEVTTQLDLANVAKQLKRSMIILSISISLTVPVLVLAYWTDDRSKLVHAHVALALASLVQAIAIKELAPGAVRSLFHSRLLEIDLLIALSTTIAYVSSIVSYIFQLLGHPLDTGCFFETSTLLVTLILFGRAISEAARYQAAKSVSFRALQENKTLLVVKGATTGASKAEPMDARLLQYGDYFEVHPYTKIVTDGQVVHGGSEVDESMITGESYPVAKGQGSNVYAGTRNHSGRLTNATLTKPRVQALADKFTSGFVPVIVIISALTFGAWMLEGRLTGENWNKTVVSASTYAITTLLVSCPCAIALAAPMVILIASGVSARYGIIFRDPQKLQVARYVTDAIFDKTGTLTSSIPTVAEWEFHGRYDIGFKRTLLNLLQGIQHPVAGPVVPWLLEHFADDENSRDSDNGYDDLELIKMKTVTIFPGKGVEGMCADGVPVRVGSPNWLGVEERESKHTLVCVTISDVHRATFRLKDRIHTAANPVLQHLRDRGITTHMTSGDNKGATSTVASALKISKYNHSFLPEQKQEYVQALQKHGKIVMFIGDGINDAAALAQADVGVHINHTSSDNSPYSSSEQARQAADIILMKPSKLHDILILLDISKAAYRRIILNFVWSAVYNLSAILLASGCFGRVRIPPQFAGLGELVSVLPVVCVALQLKMMDFGKRWRKEERNLLRQRND
ncbi:heavy metal translocatin [Byssothecium circinans]|uniref:Heavy metal translocatin n=1 Tax=Byssothecium circinans TaxID=147558 RepID=A0A6A5TVF6_9PLEO|nr:heavy metal translocatin [Byssothecium circinans]